jgi:hypothetical protein
MRIDLDECRDPDLLAAEVRRLRAVIAASELPLTDEERKAIGRAIATLDGWQRTGGYHSAVDDDADTLRSLLERLE